MNRRNFLTLIGVSVAGLSLSDVRTHAATTKYWPLVDGANQAGSSLITDGWAPGSEIEIGDLFAIDFTHGVDPTTGARCAVPWTFVVTASVTANERGQAVLPIYPHIIPAGYYQNVSNSPYNDAMLIPQRGWPVGQRRISSAASQVVIKFQESA